MTALARGIRNGLALALPCWLLAASCSLLHAQSRWVDTADGYRIVGRTIPVVDSVVKLAGTQTDTVILPPPSTVKGIGVGPFNATPGSLGTLFINANSPVNLKAQLAAAEAGGYKIFGIPCGGKHAQYMSNGSWSLALLKACLDKYRADSATWKAYAKKGVLVGLSILDEAQCSSCWGGRPVPFSSVSLAACYATPIFPSIAISTRSNASTIPAGTACLTGSMNQYDASMGNVATWAANQAAAAKAKGLVSTGGFNGDNGGKVVSGCRPSTTRPGKCQVSAAEVEANFAALLKDSTVACGGTMWFPNAATYSAWAARADNKAALAKVIAWGRTRSRPARCGG